MSKVDRDEEDFNKYVRPKLDYGRKLGVGLCVLFGCFTVGLMVTKGDLCSGIMILFFLTAMGLFYAYPSWSVKLKLQSVKSDDEEKWNDMIEDFLIAEDVLCEQVKIGNEYLFAKGRGVVIPYDDMIRIHQHGYKRNWEEARWMLQIRVKNNKEYIICEMPPLEMGSRDIEKIVKTIQKKNPYIKVGN